MLHFFGRLNAGLKHSMIESHHMSQAKVNRQLNQTFPPTKYHETSALVNQRKESYSFGGWSDTPVSNIVLAIISNIIAKCFKAVISYFII